MSRALCVEFLFLFAVSAERSCVYRGNVTLQQSCGTHPTAITPLTWPFEVFCEFSRELQRAWPGAVLALRAQKRMWPELIRRRRGLEAVGGAPFAALLHSAASAIQGQAARRFAGRTGGPAPHH